MSHSLRLYAHRGASLQCAENSLEAFDQALRDGANALEMDVHRTADGDWTPSSEASVRDLASGIDGIIATNTTLARDGLHSAHASEAGGLSGGLEDAGVGLVGDPPADRVFVPAGLIHGLPHQR